MNRKLNNSLSALAITGAVLVSTVVFGLSPLGVQPATDRLASTATAGPASARTGESPDARSSGSTDGNAHFRQALLMPYFSFVPRG
ncbi:hypothetical protein INQ40_07490 [Lysobacter sp. H21R4]|uniref:hypothetical protein n=1 Tax=Lysobacter sp. H21R4 TaxID=2781021 RepID=UPI001887CC7F|nr:hypothetical protein [Lysobacter sp. H21R4]QOY61819.1 hypothetical protein INQ40_07490 [Lysobacter sp. H21R4]